MSKIKIAIIGCGSIANAAHIPSYKGNDKVEISYFCDILSERAEKAAAEYGSGKAVTDYREVLANPSVAAVSVCTPNNVHAPISMDCLRAGKHVLCEKPAARTYAEALEMQQVQRETGKMLNIGVVNRFSNSVNRIKAYIDGGKLGDVFHAHMSFRSHRSIPGLGGAFTTQAIAGGGVLIDWGVHFLDIVMYCCGDPTPVTASAEAFCQLGKDIKDYTYNSMWAGPPNPDGVYDVEDSIAGLIRTKGVVISFNGAWAQNIGKDEMYIDFMGSKGGIRLDYGKEFEMFTAEFGSLVSYRPEFILGNSFQNEIDAFVRCVETGEKSPSHIDTAIITAKTMQGIYDSAANHREISLLD